MITRAHVGNTRTELFDAGETLEPSCPCSPSYRYGIPCDVRVGNHLHELPLTLRRPMGNCCSSSSPDDPLPIVTREVASQEPSRIAPPVSRPSSRPSSRHGGTIPGHESPQGGGVPSSGRRPARERVHSSPAPQKAPSMKDVQLPPLPTQRSRAKSSIGPSSRGSNSDHRQASAGECDPWLDPRPPH